MPFYIKCASSSLVLDIQGNQRAQEANIILFNYHGGKNQLWEYKNGMIYSQLNQMVLDVSQRNGDIVTWPAKRSVNQMWTFAPDQTIRCANGSVLTIHGNQFQPNVKLVGQPWANRVTQRFMVVPVSS